MIRILVVDDHEVVRAGICRLLEAETDMTVIAQTGSGHAAVDLCRKSCPSVVVLDYSLPDLDGLETTKQLSDLTPAPRVLILTMHDNEEYATRAIRNGAKGFIVKLAPADELLQAVRKVAAGGVYVTPAISDEMVRRLGVAAADVPETQLSDRELQVLTRLASGATTREVAAELHLSASTVETYRSRVLEKLDLRNNSDMTRFAIRRGLIDAE